MSGRTLTAAEVLGWRMYWDGWPICPTCQSRKLAPSGRKDWPVPADYGASGVPNDAKCLGCNASPEIPAHTGTTKEG